MTQKPKARKGNSKSEKGVSLPLQRKDLPQIPAVEIDRFIRHLTGQGIAVESGRVAVEDLDPIQDSLMQERVAAKAKTFAADTARVKPFIVSIDGYIIDSHHQWAALKHIGPKQLVRIWLVHLTIEELINQARKFKQGPVKAGKPSEQKVKGPQTCGFLPRKR